MATQINFNKETVSTAYLSDQFYIFESDVNGGYYENVGSLVRAGAKASGIEYIGAIQKPGLDWSGTIHKLWLIFKDSSSTDAGSYAIVMDVDDRLEIPPENNLFGDLLGSVFYIRLKRVIYSHNLAPNLDGASRKAILGKDADRVNLEPVIDWPPQFKAGLIYQLAIGLGGEEIDFPYVDALPRSMKYDKKGNAVVDGGVTTALDYAKGQYDSQITALKDRDKRARKAGKSEGRLTDREKDQIKKLKKYSKETKALKDLILQPSIEVNGTGIKNIIVTNKGQSLNIKFTASLKLGPVTAKVLGLQLIFQPGKDELVDWGVTGVAIDIKKPPQFTAAGALLFNKEFTSIKGGLAIGLTRWSILVLAAYDKVREAKKDNPREFNEFISFFAFGFLGGDMITLFNIITINGLALTFGFNRSLHFPTDMGELPDHPLIKAASTVPSPEKPSATEPKPDSADAGSLPVGGGASPAAEEDTLEESNQDMKEGLVGMLKSLNTFVPPKQGSFFFGLGLRAKVVELVELFLMPVVTVEMDPEKEMPNVAGVKVQVFGLATASFPKDVDPSLAPLELKLAFGAELYLAKNDKGKLEMKQLLVGGTLFDSAIRVIPDVDLSLEGGFAFLKNETGFVLTVGGYGTILTPGNGWPLVNPVSIAFNPVDQISLSAEAYFFICDKCLGFGMEVSGRAEVGFSRVSGRASFAIGLHALMNYDPFFLKVEAHANFHLALEVDYYLSSKSARLDLQAQVVMMFGKEIPFSGWAEIELHILFSFSVAVDWGIWVDAPPALEWEEYIDKFKLKKEEKLQLSNTRIAGGLVNQKGIFAIVDPNEVVLEAEAYFPSLDIHSDTISLAPERIDKRGSQAVGIQIMGWKSDTYQSKLNPRLRIDLLDREGNPVPVSGFDYEVIYQDAPAALWHPADYEGFVPKPDPHGPNTIDRVIKGLRLIANAPIAGEGHDIPKDNLSFDITHADEVELYAAEALSRGRQTSETELADRMDTHRPDADLLEALGLEAAEVAFSKLQPIDLQAVPYLA